ncbi:MAG: serine/threonine-protein kinase [Cyanobacteria bacterium P01_A01_bin.17]
MKLLLADRYRLRSLLGSGGSALTYAAIDEHRLNTPCVVKQFWPLRQGESESQKARKLFRQEAAILSEIGHHPQIPSLLAFLEMEDQLYLVQDFFEGQTLFQEWTQKGALDEQQIWQILTDLLSVLKFIHEKDIIHRDIKPGNIIRQSQGFPILIDFGSALHARYPLLSSAGTPGYISPEQLQGRVYPASDLYALGVTCFRLMMNSLTENDGFDSLFNFEPQQWTWRDAGVSMSAELSQVFDKLLQPDIEHRFQSADAALRMLHHLASPMSNGLETAPALVTVPKMQVLQSSFDHQQNQVKLNYSNLRTLLAAQKYRDADQETWSLMSQVKHLLGGRDLSIETFEHFPRSALLTIDQLWRIFSKGRFGFSSQKRIYRSLGGKTVLDYQVWEGFGDQTGWFSQGNWLDYSQLQFDLQAPMGHLPACCFNLAGQRGKELRDVRDWWRLGFAALMQKMDDGEAWYLSAPSQLKKLNVQA